MNLRKQRKQHGVSQFAVAKATGVSRYKIALHELDYGKLNDEELAKIATYFKKAKQPTAKADA